MFLPRIIPVLLLRGKALVKTTRFGAPQYIGDPLNSVALFNELQVDELLLLDIGATAEGRSFPESLLQDLVTVAQMPLSVGGGFRNLSQIESALRQGAEKVVLGSAAAANPELVTAAAQEFGSSAVAVCIDVKKDFWGRESVWTQNGRYNTKTTPVAFASRMQDAGAGELIVQSIQRDGTMQGYDLNLLRHISEAVPVPVVALGGAFTPAHFRDGYDVGKASALAGGSRFVYCNTNKGVLINYPPEIKEALAHAAGKDVARK